MIKKDLDQKLNRLLETATETVLEAKGKKEAAADLWPIPTPQGILYWGNEWSRKLYQSLCLIEQQNISQERIKETIRFSSRLVHILWRTDAIKRSDLSIREKLYIAEKLLLFLALFRKEDLWCEQGKNLFWGPKELERRRKNLAFFSGRNREKTDLLSKFEATLFLYTELLYWANHPLGHSFHGPYENSKGSILVREYFDLKPEVWGFAQNLSFSQVEIFEIYKKKTKIELDFFERGIRTPTPIKQNLVSFALKIDGKTIERIEQISQSFENLMATTEEGVKFVSSLSLQQLIEKHADYWFYILKPFCDLVRMNWKPSGVVQNNIYQKYNEINKEWEELRKKFSLIKELSLKEQADAYREYFDLRV